MTNIIIAGAALFFLYMGIGCLICIVADQYIENNKDSILNKEGTINIIIKWPWIIYTMQKDR